ncbi:hypothetical protein HanLR1_Chr13g0466841 [Helianthus annuus]|nr:hypothetical protein HanLR1_Chr13g0466841 [Helianthus annuus]
MSVHNQQRSSIDAKQPCKTCGGCNLVKNIESNSHPSVREPNLLAFAIVEDRTVWVEVACEPIVWPAVDIEGKVHGKA